MVLSNVRFVSRFSLWNLKPSIKRLECVVGCGNEEEELCVDAGAKVSAGKAGSFGCMFEEEDGGVEMSWTTMLFTV